MFLAKLFQPLVSAEEWTLEALHSVGLGWGLAIVVLTLFVRACTVPLVVRQFRAQREMRDHLPRLKALKQRHADDRERLQRELRDYYREHGINPIGTLLPLLIQVPVFISLYYLMRSDAKSGMFGDAGLLFIPHLTAKPHGAVLVALVTAYLTSQITGSLIATRTMRGGQRGLMLALPLLFVGLVARFPAGLAVYWITTSVWTLMQQVCLWRLAPAPALPAPTPPPPEARAPKAPPARRRSRKRKHGRPR
jgi:YidC/Oxa1 family membrane protein insertase